MANNIAKRCSTNSLTCGKHITQNRYQVVKLKKKAHTPEKKTYRPPCCFFQWPTQHFKEAAPPTTWIDAVPDAEVGKFHLGPRKPVQRSNRLTWQRKITCWISLCRWSSYKVKWTARSTASSAGLCCSPMMFGCQMDEDVVGKASRLSRRVNIRKVSQRALDRYLVAAFAAYSKAKLLGWKDCVPKASSLDVF